jgi:signal transduction histidine kinase
MQMSFLGQEIPSESEAARAELSNIQKELEAVLSIARPLSIDLNPPILRGEGLTQAISWLASKMHQQYGLSIEIQAGESFTIPDEELHVILFNCVRELLFNLVKHAQTGHTEVLLQWVDSKLRIEVSDDGDGFAARPTGRQSSDGPVEEEEIEPSFGLSTIRHQLILYGGSMAIHSQPGDGTRIILTVPVSNAGQSRSFQSCENQAGERRLSVHAKRAWMITWRPPSEITPLSRCLHRNENARQWSLAGILERLILHIWFYGIATP